MDKKEREQAENRENADYLNKIVAFSGSFYIVIKRRKITGAYYLTIQSEDGTTEKEVPQELTLIDYEKTAYYLAMLHKAKFKPKKQKKEQKKRKRK